MARKNPKRKIKTSSSNLENVLKSLEKMNYSLVGKTSAVQICRWTKNSIRGDEPCWKEKFYGISTAGCCQMTPSVMWCENSCVHCWRPIEMNLGTNLSKIDEPKEILNGIVEARKKLLMGFKGRKGINKEKFENSLEPKLYTLSLSGEPTLYPRLGEMFKEIRKRKAVSFLVTNGLNSEALKKLARSGVLSKLGTKSQALAGKNSELPTQITVSTNAPNEELFNEWHRSCKKNAWKEFNKTLGVIKKLNGKVRRVIRLTLVKDGKGLVPSGNMSEENLKEYSKLIRKAEPDFIHIKGFMSVGYARNRLGYDRQPWFKEVKKFSKDLETELKKDNYKIAAEDTRSCVVMLAKKGSKLKITKI